MHSKGVQFYTYKNVAFISCLLLAVSLQYICLYWVLVIWQISEQDCFIAPLHSYAFLDQ